MSDVKNSLESNEPLDVDKIIARDPQDGVVSNGRRVVVAEDEALIRMDIVESLNEAGYVVIGEAGDGEEAVELAIRLKPDVVVMDVKMPKLDGISAAERIDKSGVCPVVLLTAFSQKELVDRAVEAGAMAYVVKPFTPADLFPSIELSIAKFDSFKQLEKEVESVNNKFEGRKLLERAKGILMTQSNLTEQEAFRLIQKTSMDSRLTMREVSVAIINQAANLNHDKDLEED